MPHIVFNCLAKHLPLRPRGRNLNFGVITLGRDYCSSPGPTKVRLP